MMDALQILRRRIFNGLSSEEKRDITREIATMTGAKWKGMARFERWGREVETALYDLKGASFVFVPGDTVTLGWDGFPAEGGEELEALRAALDEDVAEFWGGAYETEEILRKLTTPVRQAVIPPMLVEQETKPFEDGRPVAMEEVRLDEAGQQRYEEFIANPKFTIRVVNSKEPGYSGYRFHKSANGEISAEILVPDTPEDLLAELALDGFTLPDADQWEYLCGGGGRGLFAWGDSLPPKGRRYPNFFGLTIADDNWHLELIRSDGWWFRGGDGGEIDCYGTLRVLNELAGSPHFGGWYGPEHQDEMEEMKLEGLSSDFDYYRRVILLR